MSNLVYGIPKRTKLDDTQNNYQTDLHIKQLSNFSRTIVKLVQNNCQTATHNIMHTLPETFVSPCTKLLSKIHICNGQNHTSLSCANIQNHYAQPMHQLRLESDMESTIRDYVITHCWCDINKVHPAESETVARSEAKMTCY